MIYFSLKKGDKLSEHEVIIQDALILKGKYLILNKRFSKIWLVYLYDERHNKEVNIDFFFLFFL